MATGDPEPGGEETEPLLPTDDAVGAQPLEASAVRKLQCLICMFVMIVLGLVASLNEGRENSQRNVTNFHQNASKCSWNLADTPTAWISWCIKCAQLLMAICSFVYLERWVLRPGMIPRASFRNAASTQRPDTVVENVVPCYLELLKSLASYPSKLFVSMFVIFAVLSGVCGLFEAVWYVMEAAYPWRHGSCGLNSFFEVFRYLLLTVFICAQTAFFVRHNRACIQWKLDRVWLAVCLIIATNISAWFFYVEQEIFESMESHQSSSTLWKTLDKVVEQIFSPFLIEFFIMGAILAAGFLANAGLLARVLQRQQIYGIVPELTPDCIRMLLMSESRPSAGFWRQQRRSLLFVVGLVAAALTASFVLNLLVPHSERYIIKVALNCTRSALYLSGIVCAAVLLRQLRDRRGGERHQAESRGHVADRLLLLCGALAALVNDGYQLWFCLAGDCTDGLSRLSIAGVTLPNICQSVLQVYLLECLLVRRFQPRRSAQVDGRRGARLLTALLLLNAAEWLVSAVAFSILFDGSHQETISLVLAVCTMPLQVFFRFHSIACIDEFKKHCTEGHHGALD